MKFFFTLMLFCLFCLKATTQQQSFDSLLNYCHNNFHLDGVVLVANANNIIYQHSFGKADETNNNPNTADTKFRLGSVSKQFTAFVIIKLAEAKLISLDDHLSKFIKSFNQPDKQNIIIRNLLTHTSGLADYTMLENFDDQKLYTKDSIVNIIANAPLNFSPSSSYAYSNSNFFILGVIAEKITGKKFKDLLNEIIFSKVGMKNSGEDIGDKLVNAAIGYVYKNDSAVKAPFIEMKNTEGGGGIYSTANDLLKWSLYFQQQLTTDRFLKQTLQPSQLLNGDQNLYFGGWCLFPDFIFHRGQINGFANLFAIDTMHHQTIIILSNHNYKQLLVTMQSLYNIVNKNAGAIKWINNSPANVEQYNGDYSIGDLTVSIKDSSNYLEGTAFGITKCARWYNDDEFFILNEDSFIKFEKDSNNKIIALENLDDYNWIRLIKK